MGTSRLGNCRCCVKLSLSGAPSLRKEPVNQVLKTESRKFFDDSLTNLIGLFTDGAKASL